MIPAGFAGVENQLWLWMVAMIRPGAAFLAAPIFGANFVPVQLRLVVALAIGIPALSVTAFALPPDGLASAAGFILIGGEVMAGIALGFAVLIGFSAAAVRRRADRQRDGPRLRRHDRSGQRPAESGAQPVPRDPRHLPFPLRQRPSRARRNDRRKLPRAAAGPRPG